MAPFGIIASPIVILILVVTVKSLSKLFGVNDAWIFFGISALTIPYSILSNNEWLLVFAVIATVLASLYLLRQRYEARKLKRMLDA